MSDRQLIPQYKTTISDTNINSVVLQLRSGKLGPHTTVAQFEEKLAKTCNVKYCISTTSGTTALLMAIKSLPIPECGNIMFPGYTFIAGANAAKFLGYDIELVDVKQNTLCMDPRELLKKIDKKPVAVIFVNHNSYVGKLDDSIDQIKKICIDRNLPMIEDTSQCLGMLQKLTGDAGILSFSVPKIVTTGQGGAIITNNEQIYNKCLSIRDHGGHNWKETKIHTEVGLNFKFNDILASYGLSQLENLDKLLKRRNQIFDWYRNEGIELIDFGYRSTWMVLYQSKNHSAPFLIDKLKMNGIDAVQYYRPICHNIPYNTSEQFPISEQLYNDIVYLPSSLTLTKKDIKRICKIIKNMEKWSSN